MLAALKAGQFDNFIAVSTPGGIERQEAEGQRQFVNAETLPRDFNYGSKEQFEAMGIIFGEPVDDLFYGVQLPQGWKKVPKDHSMWSKLMDDKGRERASIFYKAAFYDRSAHIYISRRFSPRSGPVGGYDSPNYGTEPWIGYVEDCGKVIWQSGPLPLGDKKDYEVHEDAGNLATAWLDQNYPDWKNPMAYWEE
jgi:hypothetical protein